MHFPFCNYIKIFTYISNVLFLYNQDLDMKLRVTIAENFFPPGPPPTLLILKQPDQTSDIPGYHNSYLSQPNQNTLKHTINLSECLKNYNFDQILFFSKLLEPGAVNRRNRNNGKSDDKKNNKIRIVLNYLFPNYKIKN